MATGTSEQNVGRALSSYGNLSTDEKLAFLWYVYTKMGTTVTPAAPGTAADEIVEGLYNQVKELSHEEQLDVQRKIIESQDSMISREYGSLSQNSKLDFWYRLAQGMESKTIVPMPDNYQASGSTTELLSQIEAMEFNQQITFLRDAVVGAGAEPKSGSDI